MIKTKFYIALLLLIFTLNFPNIGIASEEFNFSKAAIRSFQCNLIGYEKFRAPIGDKNDNYLSNFIGTMNRLRTAISWHEKAILEIQSYNDSNNEAIKTTIKALHTGNNIVIEAYKNDIISITQLLNKNPEELKSEMGDFANKFSEQTGLANQGWDLIMMAAVGLCHTLVKHEGMLAITSIERKELIKELQSIGVKSGPKEGQKPVEAAPCILWKFLNEPGWKTTDSRKIN